MRTEYGLNCKDKNIFSFYIRRNKKCFYKTVISLDIAIKRIGGFWIILAK